MRKTVVALSFLVASMGAFADEPKKEVERDVCSSLILKSMLKHNYSLECLNMGRTNIDTLLRSGYRVTASTIIDGSDNKEACITLFVEKAR